MALNLEELMARVPRGRNVRIETRAEIHQVTQTEEVVTVTLGEIVTQARGYDARKAALRDALNLAGVDLTELEEIDGEA